MSPDSGPQMRRASDDDREQVIEALQQGSVEGRSYETFLHRLDAADGMPNCAGPTGRSRQPSAGGFACCRERQRYRGPAARTRWLQEA